MNIKTKTFIATTISECKGMWTRWAEAQKREPYLVSAAVTKAGGIVEWRVDYLPETPEY